MAKAKVTRTYSPIHFEDLEPHRFEDLVRQLIYDFKSWQSVEATGKGGSDDGFDIRAYEKIIARELQDDEEFHLPMNGNLWMIQCKREQSIGPKKLTSILAEIDKDNPPYGYILVASTNFSKKAYDTFRTELRSKGVMEFHLWGKPELEDQLWQAKNDRILFTYFGISPISQRNTHTNEIRSVITTKNKLYNILGRDSLNNQPILVIDLNDEYYPDEDAYKDFDESPKWRQYEAYTYQGRNLVCIVHKYFAYVDLEKKEYDFTEEVDLLSRIMDDRYEKTDSRDLVENVWECFPYFNQAHILVFGLIPYSEIALIDKEGDSVHNFPHLYVSFSPQFGPFSKLKSFIQTSDRTYLHKENHFISDLKRVSKFPLKFTPPKIGKIHNKKHIELKDNIQKLFLDYKIDTLFYEKDPYTFLKPKDVISVKASTDHTSESSIQITHKCKIEAAKYIKLSRESHRTQQNIKEQLGKDFDVDKEIVIYEFKRFYKNQFRKKQ
ncbi:MAG: restriction endonuclease [Candidatus Abawacabacteria bacterium]|nr:restriction endonuclease [Candidatus Abawacabacteria bacterium]